eukprot:TRINITY_DN81357_c0_g1_i1.p2 TRINITY_DN81357_c0_g1~~TRINITY_DN81357_c0_g1_i1.p2  ORF type:complete len:168 (+),score=23.92 TRINITY_DN81357_c0_g1_i1:149-652(+)
MTAAMWSRAAWCGAWQQMTLVLVLARLVNGVHLRQSAGSLAEISANSSSINVLVITVPGREQSDWRMKQLGPQLDAMGVAWQTIAGPNMDEYCPDDINNYTQSMEAGRNLLAKEWHGQTPSLEDARKSKMSLFQMAVYCGHLRAWQKVVDTSAPARRCGDHDTFLTA